LDWGPASDNVSQKSLNRALFMKLTTKKSLHPKVLKFFNTKFSFFRLFTVFYKSIGLQENAECVGVILR